MSSPLDCELTAKSRATIEAYQAGVKQYMKEHPAEVPAWAPEIQPWMCVALSRFIIWGWPEGTAGHGYPATDIFAPEVLHTADTLEIFFSMQPIA